VHPARISDGAVAPERSPGDLVADDDEVRLVAIHSGIVSSPEPAWRSEEGGRMFPSSFRLQRQCRFCLVGARGIRSVIPEPDDQKAHRKRRGSRGGRPVTYDRYAYGGRTVIERAFNGFKHWRGVGGSDRDRHL
jgi:hypothetical protein